MPVRGERLRLLALLLGAPDDESHALLGDLKTTLPILAEACEELAAMPLADWQAEHSRLFIHGNPRTPCPPFASAHLDGMMPGPSTERIAIFLRELGLEADGVSADYLGTLLECAAWLDDTGNEEIAGRLWRDCLVSWVPRFGETLAAESDVELYRWLGRQLVTETAESARG